MNDIDREQVKKDFQAEGIQGRTPEETEEMLDKFMSALRMASAFLKKEEGWRTPRKRTNETMLAMKSEIQSFLEQSDPEANPDVFIQRAIRLLKLAINCDSEEEFFSYIDLLRIDRDTLGREYGLRLYLED